MKKIEATESITIFRQIFSNKTENTYLVMSNLFIYKKI